MTRRFVLAATRVLGIALLTMAAFAVPAYAQDDDDDDQFGTYIHEGTCDSLGNSLDDIGDLERDENVWNVIGQGESNPGTVYGEDEDISQTVDDLTGADHVVVVHERDDRDSPVIACGAITGTADENGELLITLDEVEGSGFQGSAHFGPEQDDDDDDETEVTVGIWMSSGATPEATPAS